MVLEVGSVQIVGINQVAGLPALQQVQGILEQILVVGFKVDEAPRFYQAFVEVQETAGSKPLFGLPFPGLWIGEGNPDLAGSRQNGAGKPRC